MTTDVMRTLRTGREVAMMVTADSADPQTTRGAPTSRMEYILSVPVTQDMISRKTYK